MIFFLKSEIGSGYFYLYDEKGVLLVHPTLSAGTNIFEKVPALRDHKNGMIYYNMDGQDKMSFVKYYEDWGVYLNASTTRENIIGGRDIIMLRNNLLVGLVVILAGVLISLLLVRTINNPLRNSQKKA